MLASNRAMPETARGPAPPKRNRARCALAAWSFVLLSVELMVGGPFGVQVLGVSIRYLIWAVAIVCSIRWLLADALGARLARRWVLLSAALFVGWGIIIPALSGGSISNGILEARPLLASPVVFSAYCALRHFGTRKLVSILSILSVIPAIAVITAWSAYVLLANDVPVQLLRWWLSGDFPQTSGVYIGPMPDGSYRVMWIAVMFFPFALLCRSISRDYVVWVVVTGLGAACSGTRAVIGAWFVVIAVAGIVRRGVAYGMLTSGAAAACLILLSGGSGFRVLTVADLANDDDPRVVQTEALLDEFFQSPLLGCGFGVGPDLVRSVDAPFSYEMTYVALLTKLGLFGCLLVCLWLLLALQLALLLGRTARWATFAAVLCFVMITASNPYLLNLFGMWLSGVLVALLGWNCEALGDLSTIRSSVVQGQPVLPSASFCRRRAHSNEHSDLPRISVITNES